MYGDLARMRGFPALPDTMFYQPGGQTFTASGAFTVPSGVHSIDVKVWGGGGGSGGSVSAQYAAGGGGGGGYTRKTLGVSPGDVLNITIGAGGTMNGSGTNGSAGGTSSVVQAGTGIVLASASGGAAAPTFPPRPAPAGPAVLAAR